MEETPANEKGEKVKRAKNSTGSGPKPSGIWRGRWRTGIRTRAGAA